MEVIIAKKRGFCPGVKNAIGVAEEILENQNIVYSLGPIIHNPDVVQRFAEKGLKTVKDIDKINSGTVLIRSHGASPEEINTLKERGLNIVDATCVLVKRLQRKAIELQQQGYKVVVIGDSNHPEVKAVVGGLQNFVVIGSKEDIHKLSSSKKLGIVCQTTKGPEYFGDIVSEIVKQGFKEIKVVNTLCKETVKRQESAIETCKKVDVMFVLGGLESANTRRLVELCKKYNPNTFHLQNYSECDKRVLLGKKVAGVTAGASTPEWIIDEFVEQLREFNS